MEKENPIQTDTELFKSVDECLSTYLHEYDEYSALELSSVILTRILFLHSTLGTEVEFSVMLKSLLKVLDGKKIIFVSQNEIIH